MTGELVLLIIVGIFFLGALVALAFHLFVDLPKQKSAVEVAWERARLKHELDAAWEYGRDKGACPKVATGTPNPCG